MAGKKEAPDALIGLTGQSKAGKDEVAKFLKAWGYKQMSFADTLKVACAAVLDVEVDSFFDGDRSRMIEGYDWTYREFMQLFGTEAMRQVFGEDFWIKVVMNRITYDMNNKPGPHKYVISDVRFDNEAEFIRASGGKVIHIQRPGLARMAHASEAGVTIDHEQDIVLSNDASLNILRARVASLMASLEDGA